MITRRIISAFYCIRGIYMSLSPEQLDIIADKYVAELYQNMEQEVINDIARRVQKMGRFTETAELMAKSMREQGYSTGRIQAEVMKVLNADPKYQRAIAENTKAYKQEIKEIIAETVAEAKANGNKLVAEAGTMAWNDDLQMWKEHNVDLKKDNQLDQLYKAFQKQTAGQLVNITRTSCISDQYGDTAIMDRFRKEMDLAVLKITTGTWSYEQALSDCIKRMGATGMKVKYTGGRKMQADAYARMCVRTACSQLAGKVTEMNMNKTGQDLVYVSAHTGARPTHAVWQGQVYYWSKAKPVPGYDYFVDATDYGDVTGLKGVNCSHEFYPYWEGTAIPKFKEAPNVKVDGKTYTKYEATQQQRAMERGIRATKRQLEATKATNGDTSILQAQLNNQMAKYTNFSNKAGLRVQDGRIGNFNAIRSRNVKNISYGYARKTSKSYGFENLKEPLKKSHVLDIIKEMDIDYNGIKVKVLKDVDAYKLSLCGYTYPDGKTIVFYANAFKDRETLVKTIGHERIHVEQVRLFGRAQTDKESAEYEKAARFSEKYWWTEYEKKRKRKI